MLILVCGTLLRSQLCAAERGGAVLPLTNVAAVLNLSGEKASRELPVHLSAAVTYVDAGAGLLFVEDETGGIFVGTRHSLPGLRRGELLEIRGRTDAGIHLRSISHAFIQPAGRLQRLTPSRPVREDVLQGKYDCRFIEIGGIVRHVGENRGRISLTIDTGEGTPIEATFLSLTRTNLWDARVRVRGVCGLRGMEGGRILSVILYCWSNEALTIDEAGLAEPFAAPERTLAQLRNNPPPHRVQVAARVADITAGGLAVLQHDSGDSIEIESRGQALLRRNDRVQISCVPSLKDGQLSLQHLAWRTVAAPRPTGSNQLGQAAMAPLLTRVADVRRLGEAAGVGLPVRLRGTVTYYDGAWMLFLQDATGGIYVHPGTQKFDVQAGQLVEIEGFTHPGDYAPIIEQPRLTVLEQSTLPAARVLLPEVLYRGQHDSLRVDVPGVVHSVSAKDSNTARLELGTSAGRVTAYVRLNGTNLPNHLVDAEVRVRGVCGSTFNQRRQFTGPVLYVAFLNDIVVDRAAPSDPFSVETQPVAGLLQYGPAWIHRAKVKGAVTLVNARESAFYLQDETGGVLVRTAAIPTVEIGDEVEVLGFPTTSGYTPGLVQATVRKTGRAQRVIPRDLSVKDARSGSHDGEVVILKARLLDRFTRASNDVLVLKSDKVTFEAQLPSLMAPWLEQLKPHSALELTGVCVVLDDSSAHPRAFKLLLRARSDVSVLSTPPYWNDDRVRTVIIWAAVLLLAPIFWVALLRRKVQEQTAIIREQLVREQEQKDDLERKVRDRTAALSQANAQLQRGRDELEVRVQERTAELSLANATLREEILERQRSEHARRLSEERFTKAFQCSPVPMAISTMQDGRYIDLNDAYAQMLGFAREELLGRTSVELGIWLDPDDRLRAAEIMREKRRIRDWQLHLRGKDGQTRHVRAAAEIISVNNLDCLLAILNDETERVLLEEQLRQAQKMEAVGQLAAGIAHDFNNILTIIQGHVCLMLATAPDSTQTDSLNEISHTADRAAHLTRQLLTFSRRQPLMPRLLNLNEVIAGMSQMLRRTLGEQIMLRFRRAPVLPTVQADQAMIEQTILNLAVNSRDAMPDGGELLFATHHRTVTEEYLRSHPDAQAGEFVCITVSDTGCGMDATTLRRAFEPFFTTKDVGKGTGLGLASVYGTVKQHGGWVEVESEVGRGTTFTIYLPAKETSASESPIAAAPVTAPCGKETILLVEDEPGVRELAHNILHRCGYTIFCAEDGLDAMHLWRQHGEQIDLLLTDMIMPSALTGHDLASRLLEERPDLKVIYTSGYSIELENNAVDLETGVNFIPKPYSALELASIVRRCLDRTMPASPEPRTVAAR